jgi:hypothetical protein
MESCMQQNEGVPTGNIGAAAGRTKLSEIIRNEMPPCMVHGSVNIMHARHLRDDRGLQHDVLIAM